MKDIFWSACFGVAMLMLVAVAFSMFKLAVDWKPSHKCTVTAQFHNGFAIMREWPVEREEPCDPISVPLPKE